MPVMDKALLKNIPYIGGANNGTFANIPQSGQLGVGAHLSLLDGSTPETFNPVVPIVTHTPTMMDKRGNMAEVLKALIERHTKSISGIDVEYTLESADSFTLADGQSAKVPTKSKRAAISPSMTFPEVTGNLVWNLFREWMSMIDHPDTHSSKLSSMPAFGEMDPFIYSFFCMDICWIQFDRTYLPKNIIDASFTTMMFPTNGGGPMGMKKDVGTTEVMERSVSFEAILQHNSNTKSAGIAIAEVLQLHKANFDLAVPITTTISDIASNKGIQAEIAEIGRTFVKV